VATTWFLDERAGRTPLWLAFWVYGVLASQLLFGAILLLFRGISTPALAALLAGFLLYTAWIMRTVWRNAFNVGNEVFGHMARALTVAWALNATLVSLFLLLGHIGKVRLPI
jgi:hypothetical protein